MAAVSHQRLDAMIARLNRAGMAMTRDAMAEVADALKAELTRTVAAGTAPDGKPWPPRKADGGKALRGAMAAVTFDVVGTVITVRMGGIEGRHHFGQVKGGIKYARQVIPRLRQQLPTAWAREIRKVLDRRFKAWTEARGA